MGSEDEQDTPEEIEFYRAVAQSIRDARMKKGLSHGELAERSGIRKSYIFELERGRANPTLKTLYRISHGLEISAHELLPGTVRPTVDTPHLEKLLGLCHELRRTLDEGQAHEDAALGNVVRALEALRPDAHDSVAEAHQITTRSSTTTRPPKPKASH